MCIRDRYRPARRCPAGHQQRAPARNICPVSYTHLNTVADDRKLKELSENIAKLALPDSARIIAQEVIKLAEAEN